ncbi:MAG: helix-turn-helix domain-containing protein [Pseudomonadota bacterium]
MISRAEVQDRFGIGQRFLADAYKRGEGPRLIRVGRLIRYRVQDVRDWIEEQASLESFR